MAEVKVPKMKKDDFNFNMEVNNEVEAKADTKYIAWCDFTTIRKVEVDGEFEMISAPVKKGEVVDATMIPLVWLNDALAKRHLISKKDKDTLSNEDLKKRGY